MISCVQIRENRCVLELIITFCVKSGYQEQGIQSIPSKKAEPFKLWLAQVGKERIEETLDPELIAERLVATYERKGYTSEWINQRLQAISTRKESTDE